MQSDTLKLLFTYLTAAALAIGGVVLAFLAWMAAPVDPPRDLSILFGVLGLVIGASTTFLFGQESATRATRAANSTAADVGAAVAAGAAPVLGSGAVEVLGEQVVTLDHGDLSRIADAVFEKLTTDGEIVRDPASTPPG